ncbi:unnamed protein product, partial [Mesorhabditis belari]|uniref:Uncharacterized protein n=1 Tax=Mesorhabditis belari TaxID=2138241 RepID=A0AAF3F9S8_9BILA
MAILLMILYHKENKFKKSWDITETLARRQLVQTIQLFLPYSILHGISFSTFPLIGGAYRTIFVNILDEVSYAAGSGFTFIPMYFVVVAPWQRKRKERNTLAS